QIGAGPRMLDDRWLAAREVTDGAVADPRVLELDEKRLRAAPLPARALDVRLIVLRRAGHFPGVAHAPASLLEQAPVLSGAAAVPTVSPIVKYTSWWGTRICPELIQICVRPGSMSTSAVRRAPPRMRGSIP